jgi:hypothetical protein
MPAATTTMLLRDRLIARMAEMDHPPDYARLAAEVLGIRGASPTLARRLVTQALVVEDRRDTWRQAGDRICENAPASPGVYVLRDGEGLALYVGKAVNLRRRLQRHFGAPRWPRLKPLMSRVASADWHEVGSELEALLREAMLIRECRPVANVQVGPPKLGTRRVSRALVRDTLLILPSIEPDSVELVAARAAGDVFLQRMSRMQADLDRHAAELWQLFRAGEVARAEAMHGALAPIVFSWLAGRGASTTRLDPHDARTSADLRARLGALMGDEQLFVERIVML